MYILFLMADQLAPHLLPAYGHRVVKTPRLDELAARSVIFDAHYSNSPLCVQARAGLLTGRLPSEVNVFDSGCDYEFSVPTFAHYLRPTAMSPCRAARRTISAPTSFTASKSASRWISVRQTTDGLVTGMNRTSGSTGSTI